MNWIRYDTEDPTLARLLTKRATKSSLDHDSAVNPSKLSKPKSTTTQLNLTYNQNWVGHEMTLHTPPTTNTPHSQELNVSNNTEVNCPFLTKHWWKPTFGGRRPLMKNNFWWKKTFYGRWPLMENDLWQKTSYDGSKPLMEDALWWRTTFHGRGYQKYGLKVP